MCGIHSNNTDGVVYSFLFVLHPKDYYLFVLIFYALILLAGCSSDARVNSDSEDLATGAIQDNYEVLIANKSIISFPGLGDKQSMAFYGNKAVFVNGNYCEIYDLVSFKRESQLSLPSEYYDPPHANTLCMGRDKFSVNSYFPALYVSSWDNGRHAFVYDFSCSGRYFEASLVQVIDPGYVSKEIIGEGYLDWVVDSDGGYLYAVAYHLKNTSTTIEGNYTHITRFVLPSLEQKVVTLRDSDVIDSFVIPVMTIFQDKCFSNGNLYVAAGHPGLGTEFSPKLFSINVLSKKMTEYNLPFNGEPEGLCYYEGKLWLNLYGDSNIYRIDIQI